MAVFVVRRADESTRTDGRGHQVSTSVIVIIIMIIDDRLFFPADVPTLCRAGS